MSRGVVGGGLLGCSIALRCREHSPDLPVIGVDADDRHLTFALECGAITETARGLVEVAGMVETLVLAVPIGEVLRMLALLRDLPVTATRPRLILDVASVKSVVVAAGEGLAGFVGTHPMAGLERSGPEAADGALFQGRSWAYVPGVDREAIVAVRTFIEAMGAHPVAIDARTHDLIVARTSHLPQTLSTLLAVRALREPVQALYGQGLLDMLRLAGSSDVVWNEIYFANAEAISAELEGYADGLREIATAVKAGDREYLRDLFTRANGESAGLRESPWVG
jgi:prephenate dehydrogenase